MAGVKITDLDELTGAPADNDILVIVDTNENATKFISVTNLLSAAQDASTAETASKILIEDVETDAPFYPMFAASAPGIAAADSAKVDLDLTYNPLTNTLTAGFFSGNGSLLTAVKADSALNAANAILALQANTALFADAADSANNATTALAALRADSATNATNAIFATTANFAFGADSSNNATFAIEATRALTADSAINATFANTALTANFALTADSANTATFAFNSQTSQFANTADSAANATNAVNAQFADNALTADSATNASFALVAQRAITSDDALFNIYDSSNGVRILGEATVDSDLYVKGDARIDGNLNVGGILSGDGSGLTNVTSTTVSLTSQQTDAVTLDSTGVHYLMLRTLQTGFDSVSTTADLIYDPQTFTLSVTAFSGDGANLTNVTSVNSTNAANVAVTTVADSAEYFVHLGSTSSGNDNVNVNTGLRFNPFRGRLSTDTFRAGDWDVYESAGNLTISYQGVKKMRLDTSGNLAITGTLSQSATL